MRVLISNTPAAHAAISVLHRPVESAVASSHLNRSPRAELFGVRIAQTARNMREPDHFLEWESAANPRQPSKLTQPGHAGGRGFEPVHSAKFLLQRQEFSVAGRTFDRFDFWEYPPRDEVQLSPRRARTARIRNCSNRQVSCRTFKQFVVGILWARDRGVAH